MGKTRLLLQKGKNRKKTSKHKESEFLLMGGFSLSFSPHPPQSFILPGCCTWLPIEIFLWTHGKLTLPCKEQLLLLSTDIWINVYIYVWTYTYKCMSQTMPLTTFTNSCHWYDAYSECIYAYIYVRFEALILANNLHFSWNPKW